MADTDTLEHEPFANIADDLDLSCIMPLQTLDKADGSTFLGVLSNDIIMGIGELTSGPRHVVVSLYRDEAGMFMPLSANGARQLGAALIATADEIDGGQGVQ